MPRRKVSIIGAGNVGATAAYYVAEKVIADIVMVDVVEGVTQAKALDFLHAGPMRRYDVSIRGTSDFSEIAESDVVVITAGLPRKPGMSRDDLLSANAAGHFGHDRTYLWHTAQLLQGFFNLKHTPVVVSNACISGVLAIIAGARMIRSGRFDHVLVTGADIVTEFVLSGFGGIR